MLKLISWILVIIIVVIAIIAIASAVPHSPTQTQTSTSSQTVNQTSTGTYTQVTLKAGDTTVLADVADTAILREQGLSGRTSLPDGTGMWFIFDTDGEDGFWMKDMQFSIDMVWVNSDYTVVTVKSNVSPDTYFDENPPEVFYPTAAARYVLELPAGFAATHGIVDGTQVVVQ